MVTILLVEDDLTLARLIAEFLSGYNMRIIQAMNEKEIMSVLSKGGLISSLWTLCFLKKMDSL
jgi:DNA-binding response OmpR family regulator